MKPLRVLLIAFASVVVGATIASAATGGAHGDPSPSPSVAASDTSSEHSETQAAEAEGAASAEAGTAPDFSACDGLIGLDNAICRHEALVKVKPDNPGLANSLGQLHANLGSRGDGKAAKAGLHGGSGSHGNPDTHGFSGS